MMKNTLGILLAFFAFVGKAQTVQIISEDSLPIAHAQISTLSEDEVIYTDSSGRVNLSVFSPEELLRVAHEGFVAFYATREELQNLSPIQLLVAGTNVGLVNIPVVSKTLETPYEVSTQLTIISKSQMEQIAPGNTADLLEGSGEVAVQRSQVGGGSPILRGFEANRVLLVVDGVRMNNAIYRGGHLQNALTVNSYMLAGTEVIFGPNSLIYGSDALGGVIHFRTKDPILQTDSVVYTKANASMRLASADASLLGHLDLNIGGKKWAFLGAISEVEYGDLRMGANRTHGFEDFGKIPFYVTRNQETDFMVENPDPNVQVGSGYKQQDYMGKLLFKPNESAVFKLNVQHSTSSNIPRYDKLNEYRNGLLRYGDWYYGPQNRTLVSLNGTYTNANKYYDWSSVTLAYQNIAESRYSRNFGSVELESQLEGVEVYSFNADFLKYLNGQKNSKLNYGFELVGNTVTSSAEIVDVNTGSLIDENSETRYPENGSAYGTLAAYATIAHKKGNWLHKAGGRYTLTHLAGEFASNEIIDALDLTTFSFTLQAITGGFGGVYNWKEHRFYYNVSSAFKAPNIDDLGKIFEKSGNLTVPNLDLKPESTLNIEIGENLEWEWFKLDAGVYSTLVYDMFTKADYSLDGSAYYVDNGDTLNIVANQNLGRGLVYGAYLRVILPITKDLFFKSQFTFTKGKLLDESDPFPHIPPHFGRSSLTYQKGRFMLMAYAKYNLKKDWTDFNELTDNPEQAVEDFGTPSWITYNLMTRYELVKNLRIQLSLENILDVHYKPFASGVSAPGRNVIGTVFYRF